MSRTNTKGRRAAELLRMVRNGPSLSGTFEPNGLFTPAAAKREVLIWLRSWIEPAIIDLVPQLKDTKRGETSELYYIQDTRQFVGNCPMWWGPNGAGYVTRLEEAGRYTYEEAIAQNRARETDVPWPCSEIDALARLTVDHQHMRPRAKRLAEIKGELHGEP